MADSMDSMKVAAMAGAKFRAGTRVVVLTISDGCSRGAQVDGSGPAVVEMLEAAGAAEVVFVTLPEENVLYKQGDPLTMLQSRH